MRDIRFRGKELSTGRWCEGFYMQGLSFYSDDEDPKVRHIISSDYFHDIDLDTLGQFTGLTDKNGKKIYEVDIVEMMREPKGKRKRVLTRHVVTAESVVTWKFKSLSVNVLSLLMSGFGFRDAYMFKVIGNIYVNPELLNN